MRNHECGSVVAMGFVLICAGFVMFLLVLDVGRFDIERSRARTITQMSVAGSLRMRVEALRKIAERWVPIGTRLGTVDSSNRVFVRASDVASIRTDARTLSRALSGYQARAQSIVSVLAQSNDVARDQVSVVDNSGSMLDVRLQPALIVTESGLPDVIDALWYQRQWEPLIEDADPSGNVTHTIRFSIQPLWRGMDSWAATESAVGSLRWNQTSPGNGGYPRNWASAVFAGRLNPNRMASYRTVTAERAP